MITCEKLNLMLHYMFLDTATEFVVFLLISNCCWKLILVAAESLKLKFLTLRDRKNWCNRS